VSELESVTTITVEPSATILLAEDDPVTRMLMTRFLKKAGYEGWFAFETPHTSVESFITEATKNVAFVMKYLS